MFNNNSNQGFEVLDIITLLSFILQLQNYSNDQKEADNNSIMMALNTQTKDYLERMVENQKKILENQDRIIRLIGQIG